MPKCPAETIRDYRAARRLQGANGYRALGFDALESAARCRRSVARAADLPVRRTVVRELLRAHASFLETAVALRYEHDTDLQIPR